MWGVIWGKSRRVQWSPQASPRVSKTPLILCPERGQADGTEPVSAAGQSGQTRQASPHPRQASHPNVLDRTEVQINIIHLVVVIMMESLDGGWGQGAVEFLSVRGSLQPASFRLYLGLCSLQQIDLSL